MTAENFHTFLSEQGGKLHDCLSTKLGQSIPPYLGFIITFLMRCWTASGPQVAEHSLQALQPLTLQSRAKNEM